MRFASDNQPSPRFFAHNHSWQRVWEVGWLAILLLIPAVIWAETIPGRYIVELREAAPVEGLTPSARRTGLNTSAQSRHQRLRDSQSQFRQKLAGRGLRLRGQTEWIANNMFIDATAEEAAKLGELPEVKRVYPVRKLHMRMDRAVQLHQVTAAWKRVGGEAQAGKGIRIAIIDSGVDATHPALQAEGLTAPEGFPKYDTEADLALTSNKVIVARSYVSLLPSRDPDVTARDHVGHGTALATVSAGVRVTAPLAEFVGVAPAAFIGNYKVFGTPGFNGSSSDEAILKAMDDAVADGMDILNLSLGDDIAVRLELDPLVSAIERISQAGVLVVVASGNNGPNLSTVGSPGTSPSALTVGASTNDRTFGTQVMAEGLGGFDAYNGDGPVPTDAVSGPLKDVATFDPTGLLCTALPTGSLNGGIALILRGTCTFETKLNLAQRAGAIGAIIYTTAAAPEPFFMSVGTATIPAQMVSNEDGEKLKAAVAAQADLPTQQFFTLRPVSRQANKVASFSSSGPSVDLSIKPDVLAAGQDIYVGTQMLNRNGEMYSASRYILVDGTSFSTPLVAGAAAVLMQSRPGLTAAAYKSLLTHSATPMDASLRPLQTIQHTGAGLLQLDAALQTTLAADLRTIGFGSVREDQSAGGDAGALSQKVALTNVAKDPDVFLISTESLSGDQALELDAPQLAIEPGKSADLTVKLPVRGLRAGTYQGYVVFTSSNTGQTSRIPYWYAVTKTGPQFVSVISADVSGRRGATSRDAVLFKLLDQSGVAMTNVAPEADSPSGGGTVVRVRDYNEDVPGLFGLDLQYGLVAGVQVFRVKAGEAEVEVRITVQ